MGSPSASPLQPLAAGLVTFAGGVWSFSGKGFIIPVVHAAAGVFDLGIDFGILGTTLDAVPVPVTGFPLDPTPDPNARSIITVRGPFPTVVFNIAVRYLVTPAIGIVALQVLLANAANALVDPPATGFDVFLFKGLGGDRAGPQLTFP